MPEYGCCCTNCGWRGESSKLMISISIIFKELAVRAISDSTAFNANKDSLIARINNSDDNCFISIEEISNNIKEGKLLLPNSKSSEFVGCVIEDLKELNVQDETIKQYSNTLKRELSRPLHCVLGTHNSNKDVIHNATIHGHYFQVRHCPNCKDMVSSFSGLYPEITVSVLGGKRASKTTTLVATLHKFLSLESGFNVEFEPVAQIKAQWQDTEKLLAEYRNNSALGATSDEANKRSNFVKGSYCITIGNRKVVLSFIDIPGEFVDNAVDLNDTERNDAFRKEYSLKYQNLDFLWICVDEPIFINGAIGEINEQNFLNRFGVNKQDFLKKYGYLNEAKPTTLQNISNLIATLDVLKNIKGAALIWGKIDQLNRINSRNDNPPPFDRMGGYIESNNALQLTRGIPTLSSSYVLIHSSFIKSEVERRLDANNNAVWNHYDTIRNIEAFFNGRMCYFATSNYGHSPNTEKVASTQLENQNVLNKTINPINTELPLLWTLAMAGVLPVRYTIHRAFKDKERISYLVRTEDTKQFLCNRNR